jgi:hypothetical protein
METRFCEVRRVMRFLQTKIFNPNSPLIDQGSVIKDWSNWRMSDGSKSVESTPLMIASRRPTRKDGCEDRTGGGADWKRMSHYLRFIHYIAVGPSWRVASERNQFIRRRNISSRSTLAQPHQCALGWRWEIIIIAASMIIISLRKVLM